jgi:hypothetical protein
MRRAYFASAYADATKEASARAELGAPHGIEERELRPVDGSARD